MRIVPTAIVLALVSTYPAISFADEAAAAQDRSGFTMLLNLGLGRQETKPDKGDGDSALGLAGLNLGLGGFVTEEIAVMFRFSGTNVQYDQGGIEVTGLSGVGGPAVQYWVNNNVNLELGGGVGIFNTEAGGLSNDERGYGFIVGANFPIWWNEGHALQVGVELAPVFIDDAKVYNAGVTFGWQLL